MSETLQSAAQEIHGNWDEEHLHVLLTQSAIMNPDLDLDLIERAYEFSSRLHSGQFRKSGEPYIIHCCHVALTLIGLNLDAETIIAGLLHDVVEDVEGVTVDQIREIFGNQVAELVDGMTKITGLTLQSREERQAEYFRKMLLSMAQDIRVIIIKLADRLHNMRTLFHLKSNAIERIALETRDIYVPLAHRVGMAQIKAELEDLSLKYLEPEAYKDIDAKLFQGHDQREQLIEDIQEQVIKELKDSDISATMKGRAKNYYSIYNKMQRQDKPFEEIYDLLAFRVITETVRDCYHALGIIHTMFTPLFGRFKDYIAKPKMNMYQSLHTTVRTDKGDLVEIQIRTKEMDRIAEVGIAAHWLYKENRSETTELDERMTWLRQALDWQSDMTDSQEFMQYLRMDLYDDAIFVFTPNGELKELPIGASTLDFAFSVHTDIGLHCTGVKVNDRMVPLATELNSGDTVEVFTSSRQTPSYHWLDIVKTSKAKTKIKSWLKKATYEQSVTLGEDLLDRELKRLKILKKPMEDLAELAEDYGFPDVEHLYAAIGQGELTAPHIGQKLLPPDPKEKFEKASILKKIVNRVRRSSGGVKVRGVDNMMLRFAQCCQPVPGDPIVGFITRGRGVTVHRKDCKNIIDDLERRLPVNWDVDERQAFMVGLNVYAQDRPGLLTDITKVITDSGVNITHATLNTPDGFANVLFSVEVQHLDQLRSTIKRIKKIKGVQEVKRTRGEVKDIIDELREK